MARMNLMLFSLEPQTRVWLGALALLLLGGFWFVDRLLRKGVYDEDTGGASSLGNAVSNLQTLFDPAHRHVIEEQERERGEHDDSGEPPGA
ncbi:MAG TPA: hypothetical protein VF532_09610 [Candidatus Angelobacter sp.]